MTPEEQREREIRRKLDEVVGTDYDAPHLQDFGAWFKSRWRKWILGIAFAISAMLLIVYTIESHRLPATMPQAVKKPVPVQILPAR